MLFQGGVTPPTPPRRDGPVFGCLLPQNQSACSYFAMFLFAGFYCTTWYNFGSVTKVEQIGLQFTLLLLIFNTCLPSVYRGSLVWSSVNMFEQQQQRIKTVLVQCKQNWSQYGGGTLNFREKKIPNFHPTKRRTMLSPKNFTLQPLPLPALS